MRRLEFDGAPGDPMPRELLDAINDRMIAKTEDLMTATEIGLETSAFEMHR